MKGKWIAGVIAATILAGVGIVVTAMWCDDSPLEERNAERRLDV